MAFGQNQDAPGFRYLNEAASMWGITRTMFPPLFILSADWDIIDSIIEEKEFGGLWWW